MNSFRGAVQRLALCGLLSGLSLVLMLSVYILPFSVYGTAMVAGGLLIIPLKEYGSGTAVTMYLAVSLLSVFLCDKESALMYILLFGLYPILYRMFESVRMKWLRVILRLAYFNLAAVSGGMLALWIFGIPVEYSGWILCAFMAAANVVFLFYSFVLGRFFTIYEIRFRPIIHKLMNK